MGHAGSSVSLTIAGQHIFDGTNMRGPGAVRISQRGIEIITFGEAEARASIHLPADAILAPGFIDIQVNGGGAFFSTTSRRSLAFDASSIDRGGSGRAIGSIPCRS
jgi:N-acetylglucosamine-6-phosphate deacetylase